jgi:hypothetical protein
MFRFCEGGDFLIRLVMYSLLHNMFMMVFISVSFYMKLFHCFNVCFIIFWFYGLGCY